MRGDRTSITGIIFLAIGILGGIAMNAAASILFGIAAAMSAIFGLILILMHLVGGPARSCPHCVGKGMIDIARKWEPLANADLSAVIRHDK